MATLSESRKAYMSERKRLQNAIRKAEKQGYVFEDNIIDKFMPKLERPTTRSVEKAKKIKPQDLYKRKGTIYVDTETGEIIKGSEARKQKKSEAGKKSARTRKRNIEKARKYQEESEKQKAMGQTEPTESNTGRASIIEEIRQRLAQLPDQYHIVRRGTSRWYDKSADHNYVYQTYQEKLLYDDDNSYANYIIEHSEEIFKEIAVLEVIPHSLEEEIDRSYIALSNIINTTVSLENSINASNYSDIGNNYED